MLRRLLLAAALALGWVGAALAQTNDFSDDITTGGTSQVAITAKPAGQVVFIQNPSTETETLWVNFGAVAAASVANTTNGESLALLPGGSLSVSTTQNVNVVASDTGHVYTAKALSLAGLDNPGAGAGGGGAGDASAANQDEQTALLTTIDGDTGSLAGILTALQLLDNAIAGNEFQVDVLSMPSVAVTGTFWQATQPVSGTVTSNLSATDNTVLDNIEAGIDELKAQVDLTTDAIEAGTLITCDETAIYDASSSGNTQLVALASGETIYVCGFLMRSGATAVNARLVYGTGSACATGETGMMPVFEFTTYDGIGDASIGWRGADTAISNALCLETSAAEAFNVVVYYNQRVP